MRGEIPGVMRVEMKTEGRLRPWLWFGSVQAAVLLVLLWDALWGGSLLAPLDIAGTQFSKFQHMAAGPGIPANHHVIDGLTYDLPVQYGIHRSLRRGAIPWWDPYCLAGWPMLGESHSHGFDPARVATHVLLPFEFAYNWARAVHLVLFGLGMFLLLRRLGFNGPTSALLSATLEGAGCITFFITHPWVGAVFAWYPFLWRAWDAAFQDGRWRHTIWAAVLVAACLCSGSLQSDSYLPLLALALGCGYAGRSLAAWRRWLVPVGISGLVGACLAAPVWLNELELFLNSVREVGLGRNRWGGLSGIATLTCIFPWCLGTHRTIDLSRLVGQSTLGFCLFIGSAGIVLAAVGAWFRAEVPQRRPHLRAAMALVIFYFIILSTPLLDVFYTRCSALAGIGLVILAAHGLETLIRRPTLGRRAGWVVAALALGLAVCTHVGALVLYPRMLPRVREALAEHDRAARSYDSAPRLRAHQLDVFADEVTFRNPHALLAWLGLVAVAVWLLRPDWRRPRVAVALLAMNLLPVLLVSHQFIPRHPMRLWHALEEGGPEHRRVVETVARGAGRMQELAPGMHEMLMPGALAILYGVRVTHGYSSVPPRTLANLPPETARQVRPQTADWIYESLERGLPAGVLRTNPTPGLARFQWQGASTRPFTVTDAGLADIRLRFEAGEAGDLLWTDTHYPGWEAWMGSRRVPIRPRAPCFSLIEVPSAAGELRLQFRPTFLRTGVVAAACGGLLLVALGAVDSLAGRRRR